MHALPAAIQTEGLFTQLALSLRSDDILFTFDDLCPLS